MVTNYQRGYASERRAFKELEKSDYYPIRASGSHTRIDLVGIPLKKGKNHLAIQLKRVKGNYSYIEKSELEELEKLPLKKTEKWLWIWWDRIKGVRKAGWEKIKIK